MWSWQAASRVSHSSSSGSTDVFIFVLFHDVLPLCILNQFPTLSSSLSISLKFRCTYKEEDCDRVCLTSQGVSRNTPDCRSLTSALIQVLHCVYRCCFESSITSFSWLIVLCTDLWTVSSFEICWFSVGYMPQSFLRSDDVETSYKCRLTAFEWGFTAASSAIRSHSCFSFQLRTHWFSSGCRSVMIAYAPLFDECIDPSVALRLSVLLWIFN